MRNTEEAERNSRATTPVPSSATSETAPVSVTASQILSRKSQKKGVWGLIEESELARSIRKDEEKKARFVNSTQLVTWSLISQFFYRWSTTS